MKIGLTYDLKDDYLREGFTEEQAAEFDKPETIEAIENTLKEFGFKTERIGNIKSLCRLLNENKRWDLVFNICEGIYGIGREAQVPALLDAFNIPYVFSGPLTLSLTLHKGMTKQIIRDCGLATPDFFVVNTKSDIEKINLTYPLFVKPLAEGTGKGISKKSVVNTFEELRELCTELIENYKQPALVEEFLPGREFTVGIVGTGDEAKSVGVMEVILNKNAEQNVYSYLNKDDYLKRVEYKIPERKIIQECEALALASYKCLNCEDGGRVDLRYDKNGIVNFIEINPLAGLNPIHSDLPILSRMNGISYKELIGMIMNSAIKNKIELK